MKQNLKLLKYLSWFFIWRFDVKYNLKNYYYLKLVNEEQLKEYSKKKTNLHKKQFCCVERNYFPTTIILCYEKVNKFDIANLYELYYFIGATILHEILHLVYKNKKFKDEKEEELFIDNRIKKEYPKYRKIFDEIYLQRTYK